MRVKGNIPVKRGGPINYEYEPVEAQVPGYEHLLAHG